MTHTNTVSSKIQGSLTLNQIQTPAVIAIHFPAEAEKNNEIFLLRYEGIAFERSLYLYQLTIRLNNPYHKNVQGC